MTTITIEQSKRKHFNESATHSYIFGVEHNGKVTAYMVNLDYSGFCLMFNEKPTESKRATVIKYRSNKAKREYLESNATKAIDFGTIEDFKKSCRVRVNRYGKEYTENCGEHFEYRLAKHFRIEQNEKANLKFTDGGDLTIKGITYQVKYERAGITVVL